MKIPVTIFTGFLGSGKTTLLCGLLRKNPERKLAVLVNEFGQVSIDGTLLRTAGEEHGVEIHDLPNGCICYTIKDDFLPIMRTLQVRKNEVDHVLIETSGLALPAPVMRALGWPEIRNDFQLDAVLAVVDTPLLLGGGFEGGKPVPGLQDIPEHTASVDVILNQQLESADVVVLNKIDDLSEDALLKAEEIVRSKASKVRFLELAFHAELDTRLCLGLNVHDAPHAGFEHHHDPLVNHDHRGPVHFAPGEGDSPLGDQSGFDGHSHTGLGAHEHGASTHQHFHEHDTGWQSFTLHTHEAQNPEILKNALFQITLQQPILRAKGFATVSGKSHRLVVQAVRKRVQTYFESELSPANELSSLVFIGYHPKRDQVVRLLNEMTNTQWS
ncbi:MAG: GTP-binding protein [Verrucomicrobia bacterium]|nr:GTP-binding protein [Verrucomicrobiota bacterium]